MSPVAGFRGSRWALAIALPLPPLAWYLTQQGLGFLLRLQCSGAEGPAVAVGALALLACAVAVWLSSGQGRGSQSPPAQTDTVLRWVVYLGAGVFALAILFQTLAALVVPSCAR